MTAAALSTPPAPACSGVDPELFYGPTDSPQGRPPFCWERRALRVCAGCPAVAQCLAQALEFPAEEQHGVIGGTTAGQRKAMLRASGWRPSRGVVAEDPTSRAVALYETGMGARSIARQLGVGERRVHRWLQRHRAGQQPVSHRPKQVAS
jgi:hypothetical protein